ncbi:MAG: hypothetical protein M1818_000381 [Claussenomyces sp. TS43310]|nr:MAG: hypothetical protein M1818_000381 [Claussenomyces sp. TS43310]
MDSPGYVVDATSRTMTPRQSKVSPAQKVNVHIFGQDQPANTPSKSVTPSHTIKAPRLTTTPRLPAIEKGEKLRSHFIGLGILDNSPGKESEPSSTGTSPSLTMTPRQPTLTQAEKLSIHFFGQNSPSQTPTKKPDTMNRFAKMNHVRGHFAQGGFFQDLKKIGDNLKTSTRSTCSDADVSSISQAALELQVKHGNKTDEQSDEPGHHQVLQKLREFGNSFRLETPLPNDLLDIVGKGKTKNMNQNGDLARIGGSKIIELAGIDPHLHGFGIGRQLSQIQARWQKAQENSADAPFKLARGRITDGSFPDLRRANSGSITKSRRKLHKYFGALKAKEYEDVAEYIQRQAFDSIARVELLDIQIQAKEAAIKASKDNLERMEQAFKNLQIIAEYKGTDLNALRAALPSAMAAANSSSGQDDEIDSDYWTGDLDGETVGCESDSDFLQEASDDQFSVCSMEE